MIKNYIYIILNILSVVMLIFFVQTRMKAGKRFKTQSKNSILLKSGIDDISIYLSVFLTILVLWRIDTAFSIYGINLLIRDLFRTDLFIITSIIVIILYYIINRNTITTAGIGKLHLFNNLRDVISWQQIVNYHWEENCLIIDYLNESKVESYLWKNISSKDRSMIESILCSYLCRKQ